MPKWGCLRALCLTVFLLTGPVGALQAENKEVIFAFSQGKPKPYVIDASRGLEVDIVTEAFKVEEYTVKGVLLTYNRMARIKKIKIDGHGVTHPKEGNGLFYSEKYIYYQDVALWKKKDNFEINSIKDLTEYRVGGWQTAPEDMGGELLKYFGPDGAYKDKFFRIYNDESLAKMLWLNRLDVLIQDLLIYDYFNRKMEKNRGETLEYTYKFLSFPEKNWFHAVFKTEEHRDAFNRGLKKIKANGTFDNIYKKYQKYTDF